MSGIDYGRGLTNIDHATGIRYGVISHHTPMPEALDDIYTHGENLSYAAAKEEAQQSMTEEAWEEYEQEFNDGYEEQEDTYRYEQDGYILETSSLGIYVIKSPYYTYAAFCSPCAPGAGDLDTPREDGVKTYCLGPDWFEHDTAPYPVFKVSDDSEEKAND